MKKVLAVFLAALMLLTGTVSAFAAEAPTGSKLQFNKDGKFKILILADPQDGYPLNAGTIAVMEEAMDKTQPDFIVFLGDNVMRPKYSNDDPDYLEYYWKGYDEMFQPVADRGIPFSFVFGNHDDDRVIEEVTKELILKKIQSFDGCMAYNADDSLHGYANHNIEILSSDGKKTAFNMWFLDSGEYVHDENGERLHYDCIRKNQIDWYTETSKKLEAENGGKVPSFMFQHMVPLEVAKQVMVTLPFHMPENWVHFNNDDGTAVTYLANILGYYDGFVAEGPSASTETEGFWDAMVERGDVLADFFGHDHRNSFCANVNGIDGINVPGCTYHAYQSFIHHGCALLTLDEKDLSTYKMDMIYTADLALEPGSKLPGLERTKAEYMVSKCLRILVDTLVHYGRILVQKFLSK